MGNSENMFLRDHRPEADPQIYFKVCHKLVMFLFFMFHFNSQLTSSSPSSAHPNSPFLCRPLQSHALLQFKSTFTVSESSSCELSSPKTESWKEGTDCCSSWDGVTCNEDTGHVIELDLSCSQLVGKIHSNNSLFSSHFPPYLERLNLASNDFQGSNMSSQFGVKFVSSLTHLNLSNSGFSGNIPYEISYLSSLVSLDLSDNFGLRVESDRVLERIAHNLTHLRVLDLDFVNMSSVVQASSSLMNLSSSLTSLRLQSCGLQGQFPVSLLLRPNLQELSLTGNKFDRVTSLPGFNSTLPSNNLTLLALSNTDLSSVSIGFLEFLGNLKSLKTLSINECGLTGLFFPLGNLTKLTTLSLPENNLNGPIPGSFCNMTQLRYLSLGFNQINGMLPSCLFDMPSLEFLQLSDNKLHGQLPNSIFKSVNLMELDLSSNNLSGSFDFHMLLDLKKLRYLYLSNNRELSFSASTEYNLSHSLPILEDLSLSFCNLTEFPSFLKALPSLTSFDITNNKIEGPIPEWMFAVGNTDFSRHSLTNSGILPWTSIELLALDSNMLRGHLPIPPSTTVYFSASNNSFTGEISSLICNLTSLQHLDLSHNRLTGLIPQCLGNLSRLSVLNLGTNDLHGAIPDMFAKDNSLSYLILNENHLGGRLPPSLSYCQNLIVLDVGHNLIEDAFPHWLGILPLLQVLVLRSNKFFGSINNFKNDSFFLGLRILDVSSNNLNGQLPTRLIGNLKAMKNVHPGLGNREMYIKASNISYGTVYYSMILTVKGLETKYERILTVMTTIDFSRNKFEGDIPEVIGELGSLKGLNLSHNLLTGHIPSSVGDLGDLEWLDLSSNKLVGQIPRELTNLGFLAVLSLSHNQLEGPIPQGKQFNTFGNDSYEENLGLCGFPLSKSCKSNQEASSEKNVDSFDSARELFSWEAAFVGYACGIVFGVYMGYLVFSSRSPQWLVRMIEGKQKELALHMV